MSAPGARLASRLRPIRRSNPTQSRTFVCYSCRRQNANLDDLFPRNSFYQRAQTLHAIRKPREGALAPIDRFPGLLYPRVTKQPDIHQKEFRRRYGDLDKLTCESPRYSHKLVGKVQSVRKAGKKLWFIDLVREDCKVQILINFGVLTDNAAASLEELVEFTSTVKPGDYYAFSGTVCRAGPEPWGELSLLCKNLPEPLSASMHGLPDVVEDENTLGRFPQLNLIQHKRRREIIRMRHTLERSLQETLNALGFTKVTTPVLAADTGGANARPFQTFGNEFATTSLSLRIAQELALKKLVAADVGAVYEIGPVFRNEGIDATHNPEFTTCEFYQPYGNLQELMRTTESIFKTLTAAITDQHAGSPALNPDVTPLTFVRSEFKRLPFLPTLMSQLATRFPDFRMPNPLDDSAAPSLISLIEQLGLPLPQDRTTAHLLDVLGGHLVEPLCTSPTFITYYPAVMSPLSKSYRDPDTGHVVSARAELFINGVEYVNMYEEENDPFAQAEKFLYQAQLGGGDRTQDMPPATSNEKPATSTTPEFLKVANPLHSLTSGKVELPSPSAAEVVAKHNSTVSQLTPGQQYYVKILEMGLPPTAGWGCGIDRLVMLFSGATRINEVLPFGNMRSVVAMGTASPATKQHREVERKAASIQDTL